MHVYLFCVQEERNCYQSEAFSLCTHGKIDNASSKMKV